MLIVVQYFSLQAAILYLAFSVKYLLGAGKWVTRIFIVLCVGNPLLLHLANMVSADAWFTAISLVWITQLLWFIRKPTAKLLVWHTLVLLLAFITSHQAVYYPFISVLVIIFVDWKLWGKVVGIGTMTLLLLGYVGGTQYEYKKLTGRVQYSAMQNWEKAAEEIYWYAKDSGFIEEERMIARYKELHKLVNHYLDSVKRNPRRLSAPPPYYIWNEISPLTTYAKMQKDTSVNAFGFQQWANIAPLYKGYGLLLSKKRKEPSTQQYLQDNLVKFYIPDPEAMIKYNMVRDTIDKQSATWFGLTSNKLRNLYRNNWMQLPRYFPPFTTLLNIIFISCLLALLLIKTHLINHYSKRGLILLIILLAVNFFFSIVFSYVTLRHQTFPFILTFAFNLLSIQYLLKQSIVHK
ncbi:MAG: hypothetical protein J7621_17995, partial [Niastella sp.]|nr:hypothetical protein [Niastella sp.]